MPQEKPWKSSVQPECSSTTGSWGRKLVKVAVIRGDKKETLISLQLLKNWDLIHESFPNQTLNDYIELTTNKSYQAYSSWYEIFSQLYEGSRDVKPSSKACQNLQDELMGKYAHCFKEELEKNR